MTQAAAVDEIKEAFHTEEWKLLNQTLESVESVNVSSLPSSDQSHIRRGELYTLVRVSL